MSQTRLRVRYAPSPTGYLHIGGLRTALYNELLARKHGGDFILRIEDTDQTRFVPGATENLCSSLKRCGVEANEGVWIDDQGNLIERGEYGPYTQSKRKEKHKAYAEQLVTMGKAYPCFCTSERLDKLREEQQLMKQPTMYDGHCRNVASDETQRRIMAGETYVIRLKLPKEGNVTIDDVIRGQVTFDWKLIDDQVIIKSDGFPTYHLASMCDDHDMQISHVIRGEEWLSSTPKHLFIFSSFGWEPPRFAHLPLLLNPDRSKLSKRQGDVAVEDFLEKGYLPEALINFVAMLGWNPTGDREIYAHDELRSLFALENVNKSGAILNLEKLDWINEQYLRALSENAYLELVRPLAKISVEDPAILDRALLLIRERLHRLNQVHECISPLFQEPNYNEINLTWKAQSPETAKEILNEVRNFLHAQSKSFWEWGNRTAIEQTIKTWIAEKKWQNGEVLWPVRVALSGQEKSPSPFELLETYGKEMSLKRLDAAIGSL
ncbi:glutamate--tRNA ligase [Candidatus Uhrbacteria bacterium]|nr:glutamate--tRNA ligase [Candidatus Uhrbacteria bacterium]